MSAQPTAGRPGTLWHTARVLWAGWKAELSGAAEYRADLVTGTLISAVWLAVAAAPAIVVTSHAEDAGGWTLSRLLFLLSLWYLLDALMWVVLLPNVRLWSEGVQTGSLDALLLRPVDSLVMCSLRVINVQDLPKVLLAVGLAAVALLQGEGPASVASVVGLGVAVGAAACLMWSFAVLANFKALTQVQFDGMFALHAMHNLARVPTPLYGTVARAVLTAVIPVAFLATVPAEILFGARPAWFAVVAVGVAASAVALTTVLWRREIRRYSGAMS